MAFPVVTCRHPGGRLRCRWCLSGDEHYHANRDGSNRRRWVNGMPSPNYERVDLPPFPPSPTKESTP